MVAEHLANGPWNRTETLWLWVLRLEHAHWMVARPTQSKVAQYLGAWRSGGNPVSHGPGVRGTFSYCVYRGGAVPVAEPSAGWRGVRAAASTRRPLLVSRADCARGWTPTRWSIQGFHVTRPNTSMPWCIIVKSRADGFGRSSMQTSTDRLQRDIRTFPGLRMTEARKSMRW